MLIINSEMLPASTLIDSKLILSGLIIVQFITQYLIMNFLFILFDIMDASIKLI